MNLLMVGRGKGSFEMRGQQLGAALGARVVSEPTVADWTWADLVVLIKREGLRFARTVRARGVPFVWDVLDCWAQPGQHGLGEAQARAWLGGLLREVRPTLAIGATEAMARALDGAYLPHHSFAGLRPRVPTASRVVGYIGNPAYLDHWVTRLQRLCPSQGLTFVVNPPDPRAVDIFVALRGGIWDGWMPRQWKSGVKLAHAICAGRPVITQRSAAYEEMQPDGAVLPDEGDRDVALAGALEACLARWTDAAALARAEARAVRYSLEAVAARYLAILTEVATCSTSV